MASNRPRSREKNVTGGSKGVKRRGSGLGTGPVGSGTGPVGGGLGTNGNAGGDSFDFDGPSSGNVTRASGGKSPLLIIIVLVLSLVGGGGGLSALLPMLLGGGSDTGADLGQNLVGDLLGGGSSGGNTSTGGGTSDSGGGLLGGLGALLNTGSSSSGWELGSNTGRLNTEVDSQAREKRTQILGKGKDEVTIMVYMCGTDLESRSGMGTSDLQEMLAADFGDNVNLIVFTGGCKKWQNNVVSNSVNQIYQITDGKMKLLKKEFSGIMAEAPSADMDMMKRTKSVVPWIWQKLIRL